MSGHKFRRTWDRISKSFWFYPVVMLFLGILLARIMMWIDVWLPNTAIRPWFLYTGSAAEARTILLGLAGTILATASVVYSLLTVPLSVAASQFGSRLLRLYLRDNTTQFILGLFVGTFVYLISVALSIPAIEASIETPQLSPSVGVLLCLITFGSIIVLIHHIGTSLQAPNMVASAGADLMEAVRTYDNEFKLQSEIVPSDRENPAPDQVAETGRPIYSSRKGYIQHIDPNLVLPLAQKHDLTIHVIRKAGHFIQPGDLIAYAYPPENINEDMAAKISSAYKLGNQRTPTQDLVYAVNQLVEVAVRAMSPAINDPYTAMTCLDHIGAGLSAHAEHVHYHPSNYYGPDGRLHLIFDPVTFPELLEAAFNMIRHASNENAEVLLGMLQTIETIAGRAARPELRVELLRHVELVEAECAASRMIDWDKERVARRCAGLTSLLEPAPAPKSPVLN